MRRVFRDGFGNRGRVWHVDVPRAEKSDGERHNYQVVGLCGVRLLSHAEVDEWPDGMRQKMCARCKRHLDGRDQHDADLAEGQS